MLDDLLKSESLLDSVQKLALNLVKKILNIVLKMAIWIMNLRLAFRIAFWMKNQTSSAVMIRMVSEEVGV